jgi:hypothetical protein
MFCSQVQAGVALVRKVRVAQLVRVVLHNALHERDVIEEDGTPQTPRYVNPAFG